MLLYSKGVFFLLFQDGHVAVDHHANLQKKKKSNVFKYIHLQSQGSSISLFGFSRSELLCYFVIFGKAIESVYDFSCLLITKKKKEKKSTTNFPQWRKLVAFLLPPLTPALCPQWYRSVDQKLVQRDLPSVDDIMHVIHTSSVTLQISHRYYRSYDTNHLTLTMSLNLAGRVKAGAQSPETLCLWSSVFCAVTCDNNSGQFILTTLTLWYQSQVSTV